MKKNYLFLFSMMLLASFGWGQIFITELADPNNASGARYVEIYNAGALAIDLSTGYDLQRWTNGNTSPQAAKELTGTISAGGFYIVCANQSTFTSTYGFAADQNIGTGGPADSNGDDQIALRDPSDAIIDMFGVVGEDGSGTNHEFEDGRAERKATVTTGNSSYTFSEWNVWNDSGAAGTTNDPQNAPDDFDPGEWIGEGAGNDTDAEAYNTGSQPAGGSISSLKDTYAEKVDVFNMYIGEAGTSDGLPTHVTKVRIKPYSTNTADWTDHIQGAVLNDGSSDVTATVDITDTYIDFTIASGDLDIANADFEELTLSIYLNTSGIVENSVLSFMVDADDHGFTADASGTGFMSTFSGGDFYSNDFTIDVDATQFTYNQQPSNVNVDVAMSPSVEVAFTDANGNVDTDYNGDGYGISLTTTGTFSGAATTAVDPSNGISTFDNIQFSATGSGVTITANDEDGWGIPSLESGTFDVTDVPTASNIIISEMCDPKNNYANDRFIEITNLESTSVDLTGYTVVAIANGSDAFTWTLSGSIAAGESLTCGDTDNTVALDFESATWSSDNGNWNGGSTDGARLKFNDVTIDDAVGPSYANKTVIRKLSVVSPTDSYSASEWATIVVDDVTETAVGHHINNWTGGTNNDWTTSSNWSEGVVMSEFFHAVIKSDATNMPTISAGTEVYDFLMESDASGDASLIGQGNLTVNGTTTVERYISPYSGSSDGWHFLSSPVNTMTIAGSDFVSGTYDLYYWAEDEASENRWYNYEGGSFPDASFVNGTGYLFADAAGGVFEFSGDLNSSTVTKNLSYNADKGEGWNLIGNPFTSALDADAITFTGAVNTGVYVVNPADGSYMAHNGRFGHPALADGHIPVNQGFFVEATGAGASVSMETADQVHSTNDFNKNSQSMPNESMMVTLSGENSDSYTFLGFRNDASMAFDGNYDAYELFGWATMAQVYTELEDVQYSINCLPHSEETITVPLCISVQSDEQLSLNFSGMETFFNTVKIELEDKQLGITQNIANNPTYTFEASAQDNPNRFLLHFNGVTGVEDVAHQNNIQVYSVDDMIYINSLEDLSADILVYNINGQLVYNGQMNGESLKRVSLGTSSGVYLVNIVSEETSSTHKVYVK